MSQEKANAAPAETPEPTLISFDEALKRIPFDKNDPQYQAAVDYVMSQWESLARLQWQESSSRPPKDAPIEEQRRHAVKFMADRFQTQAAYLCAAVTSVEDVLKIQGVIDQMEASVLAKVNPARVQLYQELRRELNARKQFLMASMLKLVREPKATSAITSPSVPPLTETVSQPKGRRGPKPDDDGHKRVANLLADKPNWDKDLEATCALLAKPPDGNPGPDISKAWRKKYEITGYAEVFEAICAPEIKKHIQGRINSGKRLLAGNSRKLSETLARGQ